MACEECAGWGFCEWSKRMLGVVCDGLQRRGLLAAERQYCPSIIRLKFGMPRLTKRTTRIWRLTKQTRQKLRDDLNLDALEEKADLLFDRCWDLMGETLSKPASTLAGMLVKIRVATVMLGPRLRP